jgi:hypothetical protein
MAPSKKIKNASNNNGASRKRHSKKKSEYQTDIVEPSERLIRLLEELERKEINSHKSA